MLFVEFRGFLCMPGFSSRLSLQRCPECCKIMGIKEGDGNPYNEGVDS